MAIKTSNFHKENLFYSFQYSGLDKFRKINPCAFKEAFEPLENSCGADHTTVKNIFISPTNVQKKCFHKAWFREYFNKGNFKDDEYLDLLVENNLEISDSEILLEQSRQNAFRAATWSTHNETIGGKASGFALLSLAAGVVKQVFFNHDSEIDNFEPTNLRSYVPKTFHILNSLFRSQRNLNQYTMYSLPDDDAAMNVYQADVYGNKIAGGLAEMSTFMETKINPVFFPLSELLPKNLGEYFRRLAVLPASLWWRARMPAYINQEFFTDFLKYIYYKPVSLLGNKYSKWQVSEIEKRGNLKWDYFVERHKKNLGLKAGENSVQVCMSHISNLFKNPITQTDSAKKLGEFIAPVLGMYGFFTSALGNTSIAICKLFNIENTFSKISNLIQATSIYSHQLIYLPKIMIPFYSETRMIGRLVNDSNVREKDDAKKIEELKDLYEKRRVISGVGIGSFLLHTVNVIGKGVDFKWCGLVDEVACNLTNIFFSGRRHAMGMQFRIENPEFIN